MDPFADELIAFDPVPWWIRAGEERSRASRRFAEDHPFGYDRMPGSPPSVAAALASTFRADQRWGGRIRRWTVTGSAVRCVSIAFAASALAYVLAVAVHADPVVATAAALLYGVAAVQSRFGPLRFGPGRYRRPAAVVVGGALGVWAAYALAIGFPRSSGWYAVALGTALGLVGRVTWPVADAARQRVRAWRDERRRWLDPVSAMVGDLVALGNIIDGAARLDRLPVPVDLPALVDFPAPVGFPPPVDVPAPVDRRMIRDLNASAARFEYAWPRINRTGIDITDRQLRAWAARIRAETRELQRILALGGRAVPVVLLAVHDVIESILYRHPLDEPEREERWIAHGSWQRPPKSYVGRLWHRVRVSGRFARQCAISALLTLLGAVLFTAAVWPALPAYLGAHVSRGVGSVLTFDADVRVFVATASLSLFAVAARAFARRW